MAELAQLEKISSKSPTNILKMLFSFPLSSEMYVNFLRYKLLCLGICQICDSNVDELTQDGSLLEPCIMLRILPYRIT